MSEIVEVEGDTIYVIDKRRDYAAIDTPHVYDRINWLALAKQKVALWKLIIKEMRTTAPHPLGGLITLIDAIQDDAELKDYPVVYGYDLETYKEDHPDEEIPDGSQPEEE